MKKTSVNSLKVARIAVLVFAAALSPVRSSAAEAPWYWGELGVTNLFNLGITGKGVKVGVVDVGIQPVTVGGVVDLALDHHAGNTGSASSHGIGVAGVIKSKRFGIAPDCELYAYNGRDFRDDFEGILWCATNGCRVINLSGGYTPLQYNDADRTWATGIIRQVLERGVILVAAGGNAPNETLSFPQDVEGVLNVAGVKRDRSSAGLNDNWAKDFAAFGNDVPLYTDMNGSTGTNGGSSFAAPMVTAVIALYLQQDPTLTRDEVYELLKATAERSGETRSRVMGWGLVQAKPLPAVYRRQAEIDAAKTTWVKATKARLGNNGLTWNEQYGRYEIKMYPGETRTLKCTFEPANASDKTAYWFCGNESFNRIGTDNVLTVPSSLAVGRFLVYTCRNVEREEICKLRVDVVAQGGESDADAEPESTTPVALEKGTFVWNASVAGGAWSDASNWLVDDVTATRAPGEGDRVIIDGDRNKQIKVTAGAVTVKSLQLGNWATLSASGAVTADELVAANGYATLYTSSGSFKSFRQGGRLGTIGVKNGAVTFASTDGIRQIGGVAPEFAIVDSDSNGPYAVCAVDADGKIVKMDTASMVTDLDSAGENDNVYVTNTLTLAKDVTVNSILVMPAWPVWTINLNGHTLTVKSGAIRPGGKSASVELYGGHLDIVEPVMVLDNVNNADVRFCPEMKTSVTSSFDGVVLDYREVGGSYARPYRLAAGVSGTMMLPEAYGIPADARLPGLFVDSSSKGDPRVGTLGGHGARSQIGGLGGRGRLTPMKQSASLLLGELDDIADLTTNACTFILGRGGLLAPGRIDAAGFRRGELVFEDGKGNIYGFHTARFLSGGTLRISLHRDGTATTLKTEGTSVWRTKIASWGGTLELLYDGTDKDRRSWTVARTVDPVPGRFDTVTDGYRIRYNVPVDTDDDGTTDAYDVRVYQGSSGTLVFLR